MSLLAERSLTGDCIEIRVVPRRGVDIVSIVGEFDVMSGHLVRQVLRSPMSIKQSQVIIDLSHVTFMDAHALGEIVSCGRVLSARCADLSLVCPVGLSRRLLQVLGLDRVWTTYSTREDALRAAAVMSGND